MSSRPEHYALIAKLTIMTTYRTLLLAPDQHYERLHSLNCWDKSSQWDDGEAFDPNRSRLHQCGEEPGANRDALDDTVISIRQQAELKDQRVANVKNEECRKVDGSGRQCWIVEKRKGGLGSRQSDQDR